MVENLINDLLDLAKMENNSFTFSSEFFNLSQLILDAFNMFNFQANEHGIKLAAEIDNLKSLDMIQAVQGDPRRYLQILLNFLSNSLKFTDRGGSITVGIRILEH